MTLKDADARKIQIALCNHLLTNGVSSVVEIDNRTNASEDVSDFAVISINGYVIDKDGHSRAVVMVQLFAKDIDLKGTINLDTLTTMYDALVDCMPYNVSPYTFKIKNQVGKRDVLGYHATLVNLDCLIY